MRDLYIMQEEKAALRAQEYKAHLEAQVHATSGDCRQCAHSYRNKGSCAERSCRGFRPKKPLTTRRKS